MSVTDYSLSTADAEVLKGLVLMPHDLRKQIMLDYLSKHGVSGLIELFSQFIGAANSVVANSREFIEVELLVHGKIYPHQEDRLNLPTLFGAMQGVHLANSVDPSGLCSGCAYRIGTLANQSVSTTCDADYVIENGEDFLCHERLDKNAAPHVLCAGHAKTVKAHKEAA